MTTNNRRTLYGNFNNVKNSPVRKNTLYNHQNEYSLDMKIIFSKKQQISRPVNMKFTNRKSYLGYIGNLKKKNKPNVRIRLIHHKNFKKQPLIKHYTGSKTNRRQYYNKRYNMTNIKKNIKKLIN